jgi:hypothetical protein
MEQKTSCINTHVHTIYLIIDPSPSYRNKFIKNELIVSLSSQFSKSSEKPRIVTISVDDERSTLAGIDANQFRYDQQLLELSSCAYEICLHQLQHTINAGTEFIIMNASGLQDNYRQKIISMSEESRYNVDVLIFDFKNRMHYLEKSEDNSFHRKLLHQNINRIHRQILPTFGVHRMVNFYRFIHPETKINFNIVNLDTYLNNFLPSNKTYFIIGDIHGCYDEFVALLQKINVAVDEKQNLTFPDDKFDIVLVGDIIDKGKNTRKMISFVYHNLIENKEQRLHLIRGNHEHTSFETIKSNTSLTKLHEKYFDTCKHFQEDKKLWDDFVAIYEKSHVFLIYRSHRHREKSFIITHSPAEYKYLGKLDTKSIERQIFYRVHYDEMKVTSLRETLIADKILSLPASHDSRYHVFGHLSLKTHYIGKEDFKIAIDTGCVVGNKLTGVWLGANVFRPKFITVDTINKPEGKYSLHVLDNPATVTELTPYQNTRINHIINNKINWISGTVSPSSSDYATMDIESLMHGLQYYQRIFQNNNFKEEETKVILQIKYMGSRCNVYFNMDIEKCYSVSRNGYLITKVDMNYIYDYHLRRQFSEFMRNHDIEWIIFDGELLPWYALGKDLIKDQFKVVEVGLRNELKLLEDTGFEKAYERLLQNYEKSNFRKDNSVLSVSKLNDIYGAHITHTYKALQDYKPHHYHISNIRHGLEIYAEQLHLFGQETILTYKLFSILKIVFKDGSELIPQLEFHSKDSPFKGESELFQFLSPDPCLELDLINEKFDSVLTKAKDFFEKTTNIHRMEGIVIKPNIWKQGINMAPMLKVRNKDYLTLIYGPNYLLPTRYEKLVSRKNIRKKLEVSIKEYEIGIEMLKIKLCDINNKNNNYRNILANFLYQEEEEKLIDPAL